MSESPTVNVVEISAQNASSITNVSLYSCRAEITRVCSFKVKSGQNQVHVSGLPLVDSNSLRVEGRGNATIHDVTLSRISAPVAHASSPRLDDLQEERRLITKSLERCQLSLIALETFVKTMSVDHVEATSLTDVVDSYDSAAEKLDRKVNALQKKLKETDRAIAAETEELRRPSDSEYNIALPQRVSVGVVTQEDTEVQLIIMYAVHKCSWHAGYDVRVDTQVKEKPVSLVYKALIAQTTGESWDNVPITLETASPTFDVDVPKLGKWSLSVVAPPPEQKRQTFTFGKARFLDLTASVAQEEREESDDDMGFGLFDAEPSMPVMSSYVTSKGNVSATYRIPGVVTLPSDNTERTFTVVELKLEASMSWISVPKVDPKTHIKAKIKNSSKYALLPGSASIYVDGSFISRTTLLNVSPQETFDCSLGLDSTVRVTYHPQDKKKSQTGFYNKSTVYVYSQRITVHNSKPSFLVENLKIVDHIPVSEDEQISVKLMKPALQLGQTTGTVKTKDSTARLPHVYVEDGVLAQWDGSDDTDVEVAALGKDGKINFLCTVPAQAKLNLMLQWEVTTALKTVVSGL